MSQNQRKFFIGLGLFQVVFLSIMFGWILLDAYKALSNIFQQPLGQFLQEPILWHKVGEIFLAFPIGIAIAAFYMLWKPSLRLTYLRITTPVLIVGGVLNLMAAWEYSQEPTTDFATFMTYFGVVLFFLGISFPFLLKWIHTKRVHIENQPKSL